MHTIELSSDAKLIRLYGWAWEADIKNADLCRLFWGLIFLPFALLFHVAAWIGSKIPENSHARTEEDWQRIEERDRKRRQRLDRLAARARAVIELFRKPAFVAVGKVWLGLVCLAILAQFVYLIILAPLAFLAAVGVLAVAGGLVIVTIYLIQDTNFFRPVKNGWIATKAFVKAIKYRTCPTIKVK